MPNGGPNCTQCAYFEAPRSAEVPGRCGLRRTAILQPHWTVCDNGTDMPGPTPPEPVGPIYYIGVYHQGYGKIPFHGEHQPMVVEMPAGLTTHCDECRREFRDTSRSCGLLIVPIGSGIKVFCSIRHYIDWWQRANPGVEVAAHPWPDPPSEASAWGPCPGGSPGHVDAPPTDA